MKTQDRFTKTLLVLLVVGVWGLLLRPFVPVTPAEAQARAVVKWEYTISDAGVGADTLTEFGKKGWELVACDSPGHCIFKRRIN